MRARRCATCSSSAPKRCAPSSASCSCSSRSRTRSARSMPDDDGRRRRPSPATGPIATSLAELPAVPLTRCRPRERAARQPPVPRRGAHRRRLVGGAGRRQSTATLRGGRRTGGDGARGRGRARRVRRGAGRGARCRCPPACASGYAGARTCSRGVLGRRRLRRHRGGARSSAGKHGWLRTYREHERGASPLVAPGRAGHHRRRPARVPGAHRGRARLHPRARLHTRREWLRALGVDDLVADARARWDARAHIGDLEALRAPQPDHRGGRAARPVRARRPPCARVPPVS